MMTEIRFDKVEAASQKLFENRKKIVEEFNRLNDKLVEFEKEKKVHSAEMEAAIAACDRARYLRERAAFESCEAFTMEYEKRMDSIVWDHQITDEEFDDIFSGVVEEVEARTRDVAARLLELFAEAHLLGKTLEDGIDMANDVLCSIQDGIHADEIVQRSGGELIKEKRIIIPFDLISWADSGNNHFYAAMIRDSRGRLPKTEIEYFYG